MQLKLRWEAIIVPLVGGGAALLFFGLGLLALGQSSTREKPATPASGFRFGTQLKVKVTELCGIHSGRPMPFR
jgi:hypothetical protein